MDLDDETEPDRNRAGHWTEYGDVLGDGNG